MEFLTDAPEFYPSGMRPHGSADGAAVVTGHGPTLLRPRQHQTVLRPRTASAPTPAAVDTYDVGNCRSAILAAWRNKRKMAWNEMARNQPTKQSGASRPTGVAVAIDVHPP